MNQKQKEYLVQGVTPNGYKILQLHTSIQSAQDFAQALALEHDCTTMISVKDQGQYSKELIEDLWVAISEPVDSQSPEVSDIQTRH